VCLAAKLVKNIPFGFTIYCCTPRKKDNLIFGIKILQIVNIVFWDYSFFAFKCLIVFALAVEEMPKKAF
jgi:hypothetical protein